MLSIAKDKNSQRQAYRERMTTARSGATGPMTARQLAELPDDGWRHDLIDGELQTMAPAGDRHGLVAVNITYFVVDHVRRNSLGRCHIAETGFVLRRDPDTVRAPDLAFTRTERLPESPGSSFSEIVPDLVVEVVSPSDRASEVTKKALVWLRAGVRLVWVIDPEAEVVTLHRDGNVIGLLTDTDAVLSGEDVLPGFEARLGEIFA